MIVNYAYVLTSLLLGVSFSLIYQKIFFKNNLIDKINSRSSHNVTATRSGGLAIFSSIFIISLFLYFTSNEIFDFSIMIPLSILFFIGIYDDLYQADFKLKFIFQLIAAKILVDQGFLIENLNGLFGLFEISYIIAQPITILFIMTVLNSFNFIDGIDGLGLGQFFTTSFFTLYMLNFSLIWLNFFIIMIVCSSLCLFYFNFRKNNKIFLGDGGSLFLGGVISVLIITVNRQPSINFNTLSIIMICYLFPIIDIMRVIWIRVKNKRSPFKADKEHLHHMVLNKVESHPKTTLIILLSSIIIQFLILQGISTSN